jgi:hypothetical protein
MRIVVRWVYIMRIKRAVITHTYGVKNKNPPLIFLQNSNQRFLLVMGKTF